MDGMIPDHGDRMIDKLTKPQLIEVLDHAQHFKPPRVTRQDVGHLRDCVRRALNSERYGATTGAAIRSVLGTRPISLTLPELEMLRHALRIAAEDGSLFTEDEGVAAKRQDALYDRLRIKIDAALA